MTQETANEQLSDYLDGELTDAEVAELEHRLARDPALKRELDQLRAAVDLLRTHGPVQAPPSLYASVMEAVDDEPMPGGFWRWLQRPFGIPLQTLAVVAVAILVIGVSVGGVVTVQGLSLGDTREISSSAVSKKAEDRSADDGVAVAEPEEVAQGEVDGEDADVEPPKSIATKEWTDSQPDPAPATTKPTKAMEKMGYDGTMTQNAMPPGTADDATVGDAASSTSTRLSTGSGSADKNKAGDWTRDSAMHMLTLREEDLQVVAKLYARYAGKQRSGQVEKAIMSAGADTQAITFNLPNAAARNAFITELRRSFPPGSYSERPSKEDGFTVDSAKVTLALTVTDFAPSGEGDASKIQSLRSKKSSDAYESDAAEPASTEPTGK